MATLTKEELRNALVNHGVSSLPPLSAKKDELVALYDEHVAPLENGTGDFSSDDEVSLNLSPTKRPSTASRLTKVTEEESLTVDGVDVDALDDDELFRLLKENGIDVGPIVASTRPFYKKKLALVLKGESKLNTSNGDEYSDTDPETEPDDEPEDDQPAGTVIEETPEPVMTRSKTSSSSKSPQSPSKSSLAPSLNISGLRQRLTMDEADAGSPLTPTPRRSIHSYKVTETTKQVVTRNRDGQETRDIQHSIERSESGGEKAALHSTVKPSSRISSIVCSLLKLIIFLSILFVIYVVATTPTDGVTPVDQIMDAINSAQAPPGSPTPDVEAGHPPPEREAAPEAGNVADV
eukprot:GFUD01043695.1.p1 GENE.GFUD01043695.1~~GFUD01043695.1.p1  ORF type:complete len:369 (-),score=117.55 GFUD01043695.1:437-1486(-)